MTVEKKRASKCYPNANAKKVPGAVTLRPGSQINICDTPDRLTDRKLNTNKRHGEKEKALLNIQRKFRKSKK